MTRHDLLSSAANHGLCACGAVWIGRGRSSWRTIARAYRAHYYAETHQAPDEQQGYADFMAFWSKRLPEATR